VSSTTDKGQCHLLRTGGIDAYIEKILPEPENRKNYTQGLVSASKIYKHNYQYQKLRQSATPHAQGSTKETEKNVAEFMEG
jgi:hypothetical protein